MKSGVFRKSQVAMEYIMILSLVLMILIPTIYVFKEYVGQSTDDILVNNVNRVARTLTDTSREIFYLGTASKVVVDVEMPRQIEAMWLMDNSNDPLSPHEYFLIFELNLQDGPQEFSFDSDIPIKCSIGEECVNELDLCGELSEKKFNCYKFHEMVYSPGIKHFKIEAATCQNIGSCVIIKEISTE